METSHEAEQLNEIIKKANPLVYNLLSKKGLAIYFPKKGILSQTADAAGKKFNATIGIAVEDDSSPIRLSSIAGKIDLNPKDVFPYAPGFGKPELRKVWSEHIKKVNPSLQGETTLPVVTNGLTHALGISAYLFLNPGEKIISPDKYWENYGLVFENGYGAVIETFPTFEGNSFNTQGFKSKLNESAGKKIILLNFPNNPAGYTVTNKEADEIADIILEYAEQGNEIVVICDDAYFGLVYEEGIFKESMFSKLADLHENVLAVKIDGCSKEDFSWGLRVGFITLGTKGISNETSNALEAKIAGIIRGSISNVSHLSQSLLLQAMNSEKYEAEKREKVNLLKKRFDSIKETLKDGKFSEVFSQLPCNSGYFTCFELKEGIDSEKLRQLLLEKYDTGIITNEKLVRVAFSGLCTDRIPEMLENLYKACIETRS